MKKAVFFTVALALSLVLCACGSASPAKATETTPPQAPVAEEPAMPIAEAPVAEAPAVAETPEPTPTKSEEERALDLAKRYLEDASGAVFYSHGGIVDLIELNGFDHEAAVYAADHCGADWYEMVWGELNAYWSPEGFGPQDAISDLQLRGFSYDEAMYAVTRFCEENGIAMPD